MAMKNNQIMKRDSGRGTALRLRRASMLTLSLALPLTLFSQEVPKPAPAHKGNLLLENATIHVGNGTIAQGNILITDDKIVAVGVTDLLPQGLQRIDLRGKHVYPGLIAPVTQLGLSEIEAVRSTNDRSEIGAVNPNIRAIIGFNTDSRVATTVRSNQLCLRR